MVARALAAIVEVGATADHVATLHAADGNPRVTLHAALAPRPATQGHHDNDHPSHGPSAVEPSSSSLVVSLFPPPSLLCFSFGLIDWIKFDFI